MKCRTSGNTSWYRVFVSALLLTLFVLASAGAQGTLVVDGDFEQNETGKQLRSKEKPQGWYESRKDGKKARLLLKLSKKPVGGNETIKAMIKASPEYNTYLSQILSQPVEDNLSMQWDIYVKEIFPPYNRSAFQILGDASVKGRGPNATGRERFVFLGFEKIPGADNKMNLFAFVGGVDQEWDNKTILVENLEMKHWYTVKVELDVKAGVYNVIMPGIMETPIELTAFKTKKHPIPTKISHISFASWNDGPGTFYVDNVR